MMQHFTNFSYKTKVTIKAGCRRRIREEMPREEYKSKCEEGVGLAANRQTTNVGGNLMPVSVDCGRLKLIIAPT